VTAPKQTFTTGHKPAGPPYFDGNFKGVCSQP
jgi:hypothetical protein